jgi:hypothetical protein
MLDMSEESETKEPRSRSQLSFPPQRGYICFEGRKATQFWLRAFDLLSEIEMVQKVLNDNRERKRAVAPIIAEYQIDEKLKFIFFIQTHVDTLGLTDGIGIIYYVSPEHEAEAYRMRDEYVTTVLKKLSKGGPFEMAIEMEDKGEE